MSILTETETWQQLGNALSLSAQSPPVLGKQNDCEAQWSWFYHFITGFLCLNNPSWKTDQMTLQSCNPDALFHFSFNEWEKLLMDGGSQVGGVYMRRGFKSKHSVSIWKKVLLHLWDFCCWPSVANFQVEREL